jgi:hypothetical protein
VSGSDIVPAITAAREPFVLLTATLECRSRNFIYRC